MSGVPQVPSVMRGCMAVLPHMIQRKQAQDQFLEICRKEMVEKDPDQTHSSAMLVQIMEIHEDDVEIIQNCLACIAALVLSDKFRMEVQSRNLIKFICLFADRYQDNDKVLFEVHEPLNMI